MSDDEVKNLKLKPDGWPCTLEECPPGLFVFNDEVCFKSEYCTPDGRIEAFCETGEFFVSGSPIEADRRQLVVQPVEVIWVEED